MMNYVVPQFRMNTTSYSFDLDYLTFDVYTTSGVNTLNVSGNISMDTDTLYVDSSNDRVGILTTTPNASLHVSGSTILTGGSVDITTDSGNVTINSSTISFNGSKQLHSNGNFSVVGDAVGCMYILRNTTSGASTSRLYLDGSSENLTFTNNTTYNLNIQVVARADNGDSASFNFHGFAKKSTTNGSTTVNTSTITEIKDDSNYAVNINADTSNGTLRINCTGVTSRTIRWVANITTTEVKY